MTTTMATAQFVDGEESPVRRARGGGIGFMMHADDVCGVHREARAARGREAQAHARRRRAAPSGEIYSRLCQRSNVERRALQERDENQAEDALDDDVWRRAVCGGELKPSSFTTGVGQGCAQRTSGGTGQP